MSLEDFDLILMEGKGDPSLLSLHASCPLAGQAAGTLRSEEAHRLVDATQKLVEAPLQEIAHAVRLGRELYEAVFQNQIRALWKKAVRAARERSGLRLLLKLDAAAYLHQLPWEMLHNGTRFLAIDPQTAVVRYIEQPRPVRSPHLGRPLRVLLTTACPSSEPKLELETEVRLVREALAGKTWAELEIEPQISWENLKFKLLRAETAGSPYHVWHHAGHGERNGDIVLVEEGREQFASSKQIADVLQDCPHLGVAVLNLCHGGSLTGLATAMACLNLPVAIGFRGRISDRAALCFAKYFYHGLVRLPLEVALTRARLELAFEGSHPLNWTRPILYSRTAPAEAPR
jgi:hypothetical protein